MEESGQSTDPFVTEEPTEASGSPKPPCAPAPFWTKPVKKTIYTTQHRGLCAGDLRAIVPADAGLRTENWSGVPRDSGAQVSRLALGLREASNS